MVKQKKRKCNFCGKYGLRYADIYRVCDACGVTQKTVGRGNRRKIKPGTLKKSQQRGKFKAVTMGNRRTVLAPVIEALLRVQSFRLPSGVKELQVSCYGSGGKAPRRKVK